MLRIILVKRERDYLLAKPNYLRNQSVPVLLDGQLRRFTQVEEDKPRGINRGGGFLFRIIIGTSRKSRDYKREFKMKNFSYSTG